MRNRLGVPPWLLVLLSVAASSLFLLAERGLANKKGKPKSNPPQLLVHFTADPTFMPDDSILLNDPLLPPGTASIGLWDDLMLTGELSDFGVAFYDNWEAVAITPTPPLESDPITLDWQPFMIATAVESTELGASLRLSDRATGIRYLSQQTDARFDKRLTSDDIEMLWHGDDPTLAYGFVVHVHADGLEMRGSKKRYRNRIAGYISIGDLVFLLDENGNGIADCDE